MGYPEHYSDPRPEGLAKQCFVWVVLINEAAVQSTYSRDLARATMLRWNLAHTLAFLCVYATTGDPWGVFDDPNSCFDGCLFK